jgi:hypothetical protein
MPGQQVRGEPRQATSSIGLRWTLKGRKVQGSASKEARGAGKDPPTDTAPCVEMAMLH